MGYWVLLRGASMRDLMRSSGRPSGAPIPDGAWTLLAGSFPNFLPTSTHPSLTFEEPSRRSAYHLKEEGGRIGIAAAVDEKTRTSMQ
jgi:hypothetical protein